MSELALKLIAEAKEKRLTKLDLGNCGLTEIPEELFELVWLEELSFSAYYFEWDEKAETFLKIESENEGDKNLLSELPQSFAQLQQLNKLILSGNINTHWQINDVSALSLLTKLEQLDLSGNQLSDVSKLSSLRKLTHLHLSGNRLNDVNGLFPLTKLTQLYLEGNQLTNVNGFSSLKELKTLYLYNNELSDVNGLSQLTNLSHLMLHNNQLSNVSGLSSLTSLVALDLRKNQLSGIASLINLIKKQEIKIRLDQPSWNDRRGVFVSENPLETPPPEVIEQGNQAILTYFEDLKQQGSSKLNEAKLIIVGEPAAGKTSLMECLFNPHYALSDNTQSTLGIEIREGWQFPHPHTEQADTPFTANIWDFGGQHIQYMTHQFFLTPSALYVLVSANDRKEPTNFPYWFKIIHLLGEEQGRYSPVLVVLNEKDQQFINKFNFDLKFYQDRYPELQISVCEVDLSQRDGRFQALQEKIQQQLSQLPHVTDNRPARWNAIREQLRHTAAEKDYINFADYAAICQQYGVDNEASQKVLSGYLHRLGSLLHFVDDPSLQDFIILKPQWAVDAVYSVLRDNEIARNDGYFSQAKLEAIWQDYTVNERANLLNLMKQENFEICYALNNEDREKHYIAPQLLSDKQPFYQWDNSDCLKFRFQYKFMPEGIITRLIVRLNHLIAQEKGCDLIWRKGVLLADTGCRAQVREEENREGLKVIDIAVTGDVNQRKYLLNSIREQVQQIHRKWFKNIQAEQMIPCVCDYCVKPENKQPKYFEFSVLERARKRGKATVECDKEFIDVPVMALLEGVFDKQEIELHERGFGEGVREVHIHNHVPQNPEPPIPAEPSSKEPVTTISDTEPWYKEWWVVSLVISIVVAIAASVTFASLKIGIGIALLVGIFVYTMMNPKRRFFRAGSFLLALFAGSIATPPLVSGYIKSLPATDDTANNQWIEFAVNVGQGMNPWLAGVMAVITLGGAVFLFYLDHKQR